MSLPARERSAGKKRRVAPVSSDVSTELATCIERVTEAGRLDLLADLLVGLREILHHPADLEPSRRDPDA